METKAVGNKVDMLGKKLGVGTYFVVDVVGKSGGLAGLGKDGTDLEILDAINHVIPGKVSNCSYDGNY